MMKAEVSIWIWIFGLTVMGVVIFTAGMSISGSYLKDTQKYMAVREYSNVLDKIKVVCQSDIGNLYPYRLNLPENIKAIYSSEIIDRPPDKVSVMITNGERSYGNYLCIQVYDDEPMCEELNCDIDMQYMGTPSMKEDLLSRVNQIIDKDIKHSYDVIIEKTKTDVVTIDSEKIIPFKEGSSCGNGILDIGEECDSSSIACESTYGSCSEKRCVNCVCAVEMACSYCAVPAQICMAGTDWDKYCKEPNERTCDDSIDNDCDGLTDSLDTDCS